MRRLSLLVLCWCVSLFTLGSAGKGLSPLSDPHPLIRGVLKQLDRFDIDGRYDYRTGPAGAMRPTLAPLLELPLVVQPARPPEQFLLDFEAGALGILAAFPDEEGTCDPHPQMFMERWYDEKPDNRLFLSFARADHGTARVVQSVLEREGFVVFAYLENTREPWAPLGHAGIFLQTAGVRLVIDSPAARVSPGVWREQRLTLLYSDAIVDFNNEVDSLKSQSHVLSPLEMGFWNTRDEMIGTHINLLSRALELSRQADRLLLPDNRVQAARDQLSRIITHHMESDVVAAMVHGTTPVPNKETVASLSEHVRWAQSLNLCDQARCMRDVIEITRSYERLRGGVDRELLKKVQTANMTEYRSTALQFYLSAQVDGLGGAKVDPYLYGTTGRFAEPLTVLDGIYRRFK